MKQTSGRVIIAAMLASLVLSCGIGGVIGSGISFYQQRNYRQAMIVWSDLEGHEHEMNRKGYLRYLVYRGLTHYRLGHREVALRFLDRGHILYRESPPAWLPGHAVTEMNQAMADLRGTAAVL
jgi:hypothetical protein